MTHQSKLILLIGPAGSGKTQVCTQAFETAIRYRFQKCQVQPQTISEPGTFGNGTGLLLADDLFFLLPTAEHRSRVLDLVLRGGLPGFFHSRITTFDRMLAESLKVSGIEFASEVTRRLILREVCAHLPFQYFGDAANTKGFLDLVSEFIAELKEFLITPERFKQYAGRLAQKFPEFKLKYEDLVLIDEAYEKELQARGLVDRRDSLRILDEGIKRGEFHRPQISKVWIDGFSDFSELQLAFIGFLARHSDEVTVTLTIDQDSSRRPALFQTVRETCLALQDMGFETQFAGNQNHRAKTEALGYLERELFVDGQANTEFLSFPRKRESIVRGSPLKTCGDDNQNETCQSSIQIFEATGLSGEIEMITREIKRLSKLHGYHYSDMAVILRNAGPYLSVIQSVFRKFQIPVEIHERLRLLTTPVARTVISILQVFLAGWNRKDLLNFLKSSYVRKGSDDIPALELVALQKGIFKDREFWLKTFPEYKILNDIARFEDEYWKIKTAQGFSAWLKTLMNHFGLLEFPDSADEKTKIDRESVRRIMLLLEELKGKHLKTFLNSTNVIPASFWRESKDDGSPPKACGDDAMALGASQENTQAPRPLAGKAGNDIARFLVEEFLTLTEVDLFSVHSRDKNKVQLYNVSLARQKEYKVVFLAGLLEKQFPLQVKEDPVLSDRERRAIVEHVKQGKNQPVLRERLPRQAFERYLFYLGVTRASEYLILSYPRFDLEGKEALPSFYVEEVRRMFGDQLPVKKQHVTQVLPDWQDIATPEEAEQFVIHEFWSLPAEKRDPTRKRITYALYNRLIQFPGFQVLLEQMFKSVEGKITDPKIVPYFLPPKGHWSPTTLEEYAECPYRFFSHRLLALESQEEGIDIRRRGTILHDVLEKFFAWRRDLKDGVVGIDEAKNYCMKMFDELWDKEPLSGDRFYKIELERKNMQEMIKDLLDVEIVKKKPPIEGLVPRHFEYQFKDFPLPGTKPPVLLNGKIDRIDVDASGKFALVIDYKTGKPFSMGALENGTALQLPFYILAIRERLKLEPLGGHLYLLRESASKGFHHEKNLERAGVKTQKRNKLSEAEFEELLHRAVRFAERYVAEIEASRIPVMPRECVPYCPYSTVCRVEKWRLEHIYREIEKQDEKKNVKAT